MNLLSQIGFLEGFYAGVGAGSTLVASQFAAQASLSDKTTVEALAPFEEALAYADSALADRFIAAPMEEKAKIVGQRTREEMLSMKRLIEKYSDRPNIFKKSKKGVLQSASRVLMAGSSHPKVINIEKTLRDEAAYDRDANPGKTALTLIEQFLAEWYPGSRFLAFAEHPKQPSRIRSYKGILKEYPDLKRLPSLEYEHTLEDGRTFFVAAVQLGDFRFVQSHQILLSWINALIFLSEQLTVEEILGVSKESLELDDKSSFAFSFDSIEERISRDPSLSVLRYFFADNGRDERLLLITNEETLV